jgi:hypothetical protein
MDEMLTSMIRSGAEAVGFEVHRLRKNEWRWSNNVDDYYPVDPDSRWGFGKPAHQGLSEVLHANNPSYAGLLDRFRSLTPLLESVAKTGNDDDPTPNWTNGWFENLDAIALMGMLAERRPAKYFEIGSGNSTRFARHVINALDLDTTLTSLDPHPRVGIDKICDTVVRKRLEDCDLSLFDNLKAGDILFFDGSHRTFTNSDVTVFFLEVMQRLKPGVLMHIHDIFLPWDYLPEWRKRMYSEQYILAAMLLCGKPGFTVTFPNFYVCQDPDLRRKVEAITDPLGLRAQGWSFWIEKT